MLDRAVVEDNKKSWLKVLHFINTFPDDHTWRGWKAFTLAVIQGGIDAGLDQYFRAGTSMQHIVFSTSESHGLEQVNPAPPRVTLRRNENLEMFVCWSHSNLWFSNPEHESPVTSDDVQPVLRHYLANLWRQTRPSEPMPFKV